jgi:hypothetical protein
MGRVVNSAENWLTTNFQETIDCPYQPGNLKITKKACQKRYKASEKTSVEMTGRGDLFTYAVGQGLLRCKGCPIVKGMLDKALEVPLSHIYSF